MTKRIAAIVGAFLVLGLAACENGADGGGGDGGKSSTGTGTVKSKQPFTSGSRLKVRKVVGADGSEQQLGFHDSELNIDCAFARAEDGSQRCLPTATIYAGQFWSDGACTIPVLQGSTCGKPQFIRVLTDACAGNSQIWGDVADYSGPVFQGAPGNCTSGGNVTQGFVGGTKMALSGFAEGSEQTE